MRSMIIAYSVNFATFPASSILRSPAKSMRPRAKSFIRPISQIEYNRQKFSISMTSEVRKCPKSAKSDQKSGFWHSFEICHPHNIQIFFQCMNQSCAMTRRSRGWNIIVATMPLRPSFLKKTNFFFTFFQNFSDLPLDCGIGWWRWFFFRPYLGHLSG